MLIKYNRAEVDSAFYSFLSIAQEGCGLYIKGERVGTELFASSDIVGIELIDSLASELLAQLADIPEMPVTIYPECGGNIFIGTDPTLADAEVSPTETERVAIALI